MTITSKFKKDIQTLRGAANGDFFLDVKNPKLFKTVRRYYENNGVVFSGDPMDDYEILMEYLYNDLETVPPLRLAVAGDRAHQNAIPK